MKWKHSTIAVVVAALSYLAILFVPSSGLAQEPKTLLDVPYGNHPRQVLDFYQAKADKPTPVVFYIHGGGWQAGDKKMDPKAFLERGISVVAINYRYVKNGVEEKVEPPVKAPLSDAARALQFTRSKAVEWNLDKKRIGATGGSAGACSSLWLAFHDDLADPQSDDPISRESTRLYCAAVNGAQVSLDPKELREWMPNYGYGAHAFGLPSFQALIDNREQVLPWIKEYSPIEHVTTDDPPIAMFYSGETPVVGASPKDPTHSGIMGLKLAERLKAAGVSVTLVHPGQPYNNYKSSTEYLIDRLTANLTSNVPYSEPAHNRHVLDIYSPNDAKNLPVVFWIHGGGWQTGDKSDVQIKPKVFCERGFVFVATNYRLLPEVEMAVLIRDVAESLGWVHQNIAAYGGDPGRIFVMGHSAGAQLAALISIDDRYLKEAGVPFSVLKGCVPVDGDTYDLPAMIVTAELRQTVHGLPLPEFGHRVKFGNDPKKHIDFSAVTHVAKGKGIPPFLILHVNGHPDVTAQARRLAAVLTKADIPTTVFGASETTHGKLNADLGLSDDPATKELFKFLGPLVE